MARTVPTYKHTTTLKLLRSMHRALQRQTQLTQEFMRDSGLSQSEFDAILTLGNQPPKRMSDLADSMLTSAPNVTRVIKLMESKGLVTRTRNPCNDRETLTTLTETGEAIFAEYYPMAFALHRDFFDAKLREEEQLTLLDLLGRLG